MGSLPKILVVDDRFENIKVMETLLSAVDSEILVANSGQLALSQALKNKLALILLDVQMPDMDGFETARLLRSNKVSKDVPIIFVTALAPQDRQSMKNGYKVGAVDYLFKPIEKEILLSKVNIFLELYSSRVVLEQEVKLRQIAELEFKHTIESINDGIITLNHDNVVKYINQAGSEIIGLTPASIVNHNICEMFQLFDKTEKISFMDIINRVKQTNTPQEIKKGISLINSSNNSYTISGQIYPLQSDDEFNHGVVLSIKDVGNEIAMERDLLKADKIKSLGVLSAGVAHEIRNPLGMMIQNSQNIVRRLDPNIVANQNIAKELDLDLERMHEYFIKRKISEFVTGIVDAGERAAHIISALIKLTEDQSAHKHSMCNLKNIIEQSITSVTANNVNIIKDYNDEINLTCNVDDLSQAFTNILNNSISAVANNQNPEITISALQAGKVIEVKFIDNGIGMNNDTLSRVYEPFFTTKDIGQGTGLGLTVAYTIIVNGHDGQLEINSHENSGTTVTVTLQSE